MISILCMKPDWNINQTIPHLPLPSVSFLKTDYTLCCVLLFSLPIVANIYHSEYSICVTITLCFLFFAFSTKTKIKLTCTYMQHV